MKHAVGNRRTVTISDRAVQDNHDFKSIIGCGGKPNRKTHRPLIIFADTVVAMFSVALTIAVLWFPAQWLNQMMQENTTIAHSVENVARWPQGRIADEYSRAKDYNRRIAASKQTSLGEFRDPFTSKEDTDKPQSVSNKEYRSLLDTGDGVMGTIRIPKISLRMPIYHGTSDDVLRHGAGHLYGTSLPVGGTSTNAVLSGHRGLSSALLFTRIDELRLGDVFYVNTLGRTMSYRVCGIHVIKPDDTHLYKIIPGRDLVTLMTCTPYGINSKRLIITGTRQLTHSPKEIQGDNMFYGLCSTLAILLAGSSYVAISHHRAAKTHHRPARHHRLYPNPIPHPRHSQLR